MTTSRVGIDIIAQDRTSAAFMSATRTLQKFSGVAGAALKGFGAGFLSGALLRGLNATITRMDDLTAASQRVGVGVEVLSKLGYAAQLSELPFETLLKTSKKLNENLAAIGAGKGGDAAAALRAIGVSATDSAGKLKTVDQVIVDVAGKFSLYQDGANKVALATAIFGKAGQEMIPMLNGGAQAIAEANAEADAFGLTLSGPAAEAASTFNDNMDRMTGFVQGVSQTVVSAFLPAVNELIDKFFQTADAGSTAQKIIDGVGVVIREVGRFVIEASAAWAEMLRWTEAVGESMGALASGDFSGAMGAFGKASEDVGKIWADIEGKVAMTAVQVNYMGKGSLSSATPLLETPGFARGSGGSGGSGGGRGTSRASRPSREAHQVDTLAQDAARIIESTRTPMEAHMARVGELDKLLSKGYITQTVYNRGFAESQNQYVSAAGALMQFTDEAEAAFDPMREMTTLFEGGVTSAFDKIIDGSASAGQAFKGMVTSMLQDITKMFLHRGLQQLFAGGGGGLDSASGGLYGGGGGGFLSSLFGGLFGGFRAGGGGVSSGQGYVVGEKGPEWFEPGSNGFITPNHAMGGGGVTIIDQRSNGAPVEPQQQPDGRWIITLKDQMKQVAHNAIKESMPNYGLKPMNRTR